MTDIKLLQKISNAGISFNKYFTLKIIQDNSLYLFQKDTNISNTLTALVIESYIDVNDNLTAKAKRVLAEIDSKPEIDYGIIHKALQDKLLECYKKRNVEGFGGVYFIPTKKELEEFLVRFWKNYPQYTDLDKITKILCRHIEKCAKDSKFAPAIKYFIFKVGTGSQLANAYEGFEEVIVEKKKVSVNVKELF